MMSPADLDDTLAALADPTRWHVIELLRRKPRRAGELAGALDISAPRMSQQRTSRRGSTRARSLVRAPKGDEGDLTAIGRYAVETRGCAPLESIHWVI